MTTTTRPLESGYLADTPVGDTLLRRFLHNQAELAARVADAGGGRVTREADLVVGAWDTPVLYQSMAVPLRPLDTELADAADDAFAGRAGVVLSAWPTPDLSGRGWHLVGHPTFVVRPPRAARAPQGGVRRVTTADELVLAEQLVAEAYPVPEAVGAPAGSSLPPGLLGSPLRVFLGELRADPVAVAASHLAHGVLNLCLAATLPQARRQGVWEALAQARLAEAPDVPAAAFTSDYSRAGFEKLGFLPVTRFTLWARPRG